SHSDKLKLVGKVLDKKYQITELLGEGGMGAVYGATHLHLNRNCAVKVISRRHAADPVALKRFKLEAEAASSLKHPNIIEIHDFGISEDEQAYIVMELIAGESLDDLLERHKFLHYEIALPIFLQVCDGLAHAHDRNVLHRDLKPGNIMLIKDGDKFKVKIVDFGVAKLLPGTGRTVDKLTATGEIFGSPLYMSPEQCMGQSLDLRSDVYALGCVVYQTLTGKLPFIGDSLFEVVMQHVNLMPPEFAKVAPDVAIPEKLEKIVFRAISKERTLRYNSVYDFKTALSQVARGGQFVESGTASEGLNPRPSLDSALFPDTMPTIDLPKEDPKTSPQAQSAPAEDAPIDKTQKTSREELSKNSNREDFTPTRKTASDFPAFCKLDESFMREPGRDEDEIYLLEKLHAESANDEFNEKSIGTLSQLSTVYAARGEYDRAIVCQQKELELVQFLFGHDTLDEAFLLEEMGLYFNFLLKYDASEFCYRKSLEQKRAHLRDDDADIVRSLAFLANTLMSNKKLDEAIELLRTARNLAELHLGEMNLDTSEVYSLLGDCFFYDATYAKAYEFYEKALKIKKELLGDSALDLRLVCTNMARCKYLLQQYQSAIKLCEEANRVSYANLERYGSTAEPPYTLLMSIYVAMNDLPKAEEAGLKAIQILDEYEGPDSRDLPPILDELAELYESHGQFGKAEALRSRAKQIRKKSDG
ncbi:MAG: serine/threonine-protein kinase, partial [Candidatus Obscuribacterales bacterium]|nr:serine/threonine-protein kinase [Candidatus Obscuribacterales bacterium]